MARTNLSPEVLQILDQERQLRKAKPKKRSEGGTMPVEPIEDVHSAAAATARVLRKAKPDKDGVLRANGQGQCGVEVSTAAMERV